MLAEGIPPIQRAGRGHAGLDTERVHVRRRLIRRRTIVVGNLLELGRFPRMAMPQSMAYEDVHVATAASSRYERGLRVRSVKRAFLRFGRNGQPHARTARDTTGLLWVLTRVTYLLTWSAVRVDPTSIDRKALVAYTYSCSLLPRYLQLHHPDASSNVPEPCGWICPGAVSGTCVTRHVMFWLDMQVSGSLNLACGSIPDTGFNHPRPLPGPDLLHHVAVSPLDK